MPRARILEFLSWNSVFYIVTCISFDLVLSNCGSAVENLPLHCFYDCLVSVVLLAQRPSMIASAPAMQ